MSQVLGPMPKARRSMASMMSSLPMMAWMVTGTIKGAILRTCSTKPPRKVFQFVTTGALGIIGLLKIAGEGGNKAHGQVHCVCKFVRQAQAAESDPVQRRVHRVGDNDGHDGDAEDPKELAYCEKDTFDGNGQRGGPAKNGE